ncbi:hypothetical protein [Sabulibacter ruber]|uniref:hypothetical protein n=1 Tax=Sabulibacter ruber TaxID=2811901 RepID=UPI001A97193A|nr:hypothetical protein [Sabulibacter ruber]
MEKEDFILKEIYKKVQTMDQPNDFPMDAEKLSTQLGISQEEMLALCDSLADNGFVAVSSFRNPPVLYLTFTGILRAKRLLTHSPS